MGLMARRLGWMLAGLVGVALVVLGSPAGALAAGPPEATTQAASGVSASAAVLHGTVNPQGVSLLMCQFEYGTEESYGSSVPCEQTPVEIGSGTSPVAVSAPLAGLSPGTIYHFRLSVQNEAGEVAQGADVTLTTLVVPPAIAAAWSLNVSGDGADLRAGINPGGGDTRYRFEYGPTAAYGTSAPVPDGDLGAGTVEQVASAHLQGLAAGTGYHYRVVATNTAGTAIGADHTLTTQEPVAPGGAACANAALRVGPSAQLPDCRAYEQVSPANKEGGYIISGSSSQTFGNDASIDGSKMAFQSVLPFPGSQAGGVQYDIASRERDGWVTQSLLPQQAPSPTLAISEVAPNFTGYSADLSKAVLENGGNGFAEQGIHGLEGQDDPPLVNGEPAHNQNLFLRDNLTNSYQLVDETPPAVASGKAYFQGASADYSHIVFRSPAQLTPEAPLGTQYIENLFEWSSGHLSLVSQIPVPPATRCGGAGPACAPVVTGAKAGYSLGPIYGNNTNVVSNDGSKVFFETTSYNAEPTHVYMRYNDTTVQIDASQKTNGPGPGGTDPNGSKYGVYWGATPDGSKVFFTSCEQLTNDSTAHSSIPAAGQEYSECKDNNRNRAGSDLYEYDTHTAQLTDLTVDSNASSDASCSPADGSFCGASVQGVLGYSDDGSYVYFVANGVLAPGAHDGGCGFFEEPTVTCSLYVAHDGTTKLIATLSASHPEEEWRDGGYARVTPDGRHLAFMNDRGLTGYDNLDAASGLPDREIYLYDATTGRLVCVSCNPTGERPAGPSTLDPIQRAENALLTAYRPARNLSVDGGRLFFDSLDALVPAASNGKQNVYEYELAGEGGCGSSPGCVYLISSGASASGSTFLDASANGDDVFFVTTSRLVPQDGDTLFDVYDARVGGGFPFAQPLSPCSGDGCRGALAAPPSSLSVASSAFAGPGDLSHGGGVSARAVGRLRLLGRAVKGQMLVLRVSVPAGGRVTVSGAAVAGVGRSVSSGGAYTLSARLSARARETLRRRHRLRLTVRVGYAPVGGAASAESVSFTIRTGR
jgi:hypothetical protein